jgi:hypothetical protein
MFAVNSKWLVEVMMSQKKGKLAVSNVAKTTIY